ncbi:hypothetical protein EUX98_g2091 [Antrodiella citrinella]|uniref:Uncharacterized protein n=1 Tax=Antrodiella citrinella TaxID=2447956 RepID=A0A4S4MZV5_9APHY|nr:hypothetical protein EUX98_g2091 [Antrodiella citrinella]
MAAKTQPATSSSRLSVFGFGSISRGASSSHARALEDPEENDDWYIPYNGPVEQPTRQSGGGSGSNGGGDRDSWGDVLTGWLSERGSAYNARKDGEQMFRTTRNRVLSNASHFSTSSSRAPQGRSELRNRPSVPSFIDLDQAGGIGASPMPTERTPQLPTPPPAVSPPPNNRASLASILSFGRKSLHHASSMDQLSLGRNPDDGSLRRRVNASASTSSVPPPRQRATDPAPSAYGLRQETIAEDSEYYYSSLLVHSSTRGVSSRQSPFSFHSVSTDPARHPYAAVTNAALDSSRSAPPAVKGKTRFLDPSRLNLNLLDPRGPKVPDYLKPSPRNSILKASVSTPNLRDIPRGKQRWLSAETWCDALILPRPRFALRLVDGSPSGRIVSPPESPLSPSEAKFPLIGSRSDSAQSHGHSPKELKKARSMGNLFSSAAAAAVPVDEKRKSPVRQAVVPSTLKPNRPKSWALDDLAIPSPVPSLAQVVAEGERLKAERKEWQSKATQSFQNKRARSVRARSKSVGSSQVRSRTLSVSAQANAFNFVTERALLGSQARPPTIHVHGPPAKNHRRSLSTGAGQTQSSVSHPTSGQHIQSKTSRTRSHGHSNSVGHTISYRSVTTDSTTHGHLRTQSLSKSALKMVKSTAVGAAAFCGLNGMERSPTIPGDERANAFEGALRHNNTAMFKVGEHGSVMVAEPTSPTAALAMVSSGVNGFHGSSPTPSGASMSAEGVGLAFSSPEDQLRRYSQSIIMPSHPYAQGSGYYRQPVKLHIPEYTPPHSNAPSPQSTGSVNQRRQAVTRPYAPLSHPYAANMRPKPQQLEITASPCLYAELTPGHISEFDPDYIQYSPYVASPEEGPLSPQPPPQETSLLPTASGHPYGPSTSRYSELGIGEALTHTLRTQTSMDSGLGTSEAGGHNHVQVQVIRAPEYSSPPVILHSPDSDEQHEQPSGTYFDEESPGNVYQRSAEASSQALAASDRVSQSSDSPLSRPALSSRQNSLPLDVSSQASRSLSGLTNLARQLSEDLVELREVERDLSFSERDSRTSPMWGSRYGGMRGDRPDEMDDNNNVVTSHSHISSESSSFGGSATLPLRLPTDNNFSDPDANFPEDIRMDETESSRASSVLDGSNFHDETSSYLRVGEVDAGSTPSIMMSPYRESTRLSVIADEAGLDEAADGGPGPLRVLSQYSAPSRYSSLIAPLTPNERTSYMTSDTEPSRMSGLSDFPVPPTQTSVFGMSSESTSESYHTAETETAPRDRPQHSLLREASKDTFGYQHEYDSHIGEAF